MTHFLAFTTFSCANLWKTFTCVNDTSLQGLLFWGFFFSLRIVGRRHWAIVCYLFPMIYHVMNDNSKSILLSIMCLILCCKGQEPLIHLNQLDTLLPFPHLFEISSTQVYWQFSQCLLCAKHGGGLAH